MKTDRTNNEDSTRKFSRSSKQDTAPLSGELHEKFRLAEQRFKLFQRLFLLLPGRAFRGKGIFHLRRLGRNFQGRTAVGSWRTELRVRKPTGHSYDSWLDLR